MIKLPEPAKRPTMYFVGVTTGQSSIMKMFPIWAKELGLDAEIKGIDLPIHAPAEDYRAVVQFFRDDPLSLGALVTTHKIDMYNAAKDNLAARAEAAYKVKVQHKRFYIGHKRHSFFLT